jgi:hypothetical protein
MTSLGDAHFDSAMRETRIVKISIKYQDLRRGNREKIIIKSHSAVTSTFYHYHLSLKTGIYAAQKAFFSIAATLESKHTSHQILQTSVKIASTLYYQEKSTNYYMTFVR